MLFLKDNLFLRNTFGLVQVTMDLRKSIIHFTEDNVNACIFSKKDHKHCIPLMQLEFNVLIHILPLYVFSFKLYIWPFSSGHKSIICSSPSS